MYICMYEYMVSDGRFFRVVWDVFVVKRWCGVKWLEFGCGS